MELAESEKSLDRRIHWQIKKTPTVPGWRDRKRHLWLLGTVVPGLVVISWFGGYTTACTAFWWSGAFLTFGVVPLLDYVVGPDASNPPDRALARLEGDPLYQRATCLYLPAQYLSLVLACWLWAGGGWVRMTWPDKSGLMVTLGIVGGCAINVAHDLGHKSAHTYKKLSKLALAQSCYGHFHVEHNRGHHLRVATPQDPASARMGESIYRFIPRSIVGGLRSAWSSEKRRLARRARHPWCLQNELLNGWLLSIGLFAVLSIWFGVVVLPWLLGQAVIAICLLETVNYLEHYGLRRQKVSRDRYESVKPSHSWNSSTVVASIFLFNLQRHSDHHAHPLRPYQALRHSDEAPQLPAGYCTLIMTAWIPPWWRRVMDRRVLDHYGGDIKRAAVSPRRAKQLRPRNPSTS